MPEPIKCDVCKQLGLRGLAYAAPDGWWYAQIYIEDLRQVVVAYACSVVCKDKLWERGPGPRIPGADKLIARLSGQIPRCDQPEGCKAADCPEHGAVPPAIHPAMRRGV